MKLTTTVSDWYNLPPGFAPAEPLYVFTDTHGCTKALKRLLKHLPQDAKPVFLGDAVDRGPDSVGVLQILWDLHLKKGALFCRGNHDSMAWFSLVNDESHSSWLKSVWRNNGCRVTEKAFEEAKNQGLPQSSLLTLGPKLFEDYWQTAKNWHLSGNILLVHAGLPEDANEDFLNMDPRTAATQEDSPYWWRPSYFDTSGFEKARIVLGQEVFVLCGHTPVKPELSLQKFGIMVDLGYKLKRAVELRDNQYRTIDTPCDEPIVH
ncbi:MAG: serine/threonine protein phosphatase [Desulfovibrionaceae bacterium]|nr:serine/threonine protein phosphatase [Desulfovibrionaceae bacterium]